MRGMNRGKGGWRLAAGRAKAAGVAAGLAALAAAAGPGMAETLPKSWELARMANEDVPRGWSAPRTEGDLVYRAAAGGSQCMIYVPVWWEGDGLRPPENKVYAVELTYKDTAAAPSIFLSYGWLGRYGAASEVHRFGGAGDGQWKTARIPVSADQLIRVPDRMGQTAFGVRAAADLAVSSIRVTEARPEDEARYNAETRAWVRTAQAEKGRKTPVQTKAAALPAGEAAGAVVAFPWPALVPLLPGAAPAAEQVGGPIRVRMCLDEYENGSFGVYANEKALTGVRYEVGELKGPGGALRAAVIPRTAEYALVRKGETLTWFPTRLWPAHAVDVPRGRSQWFVINFLTRRGEAKPGVYTGTVRISADQGTAELPLRVEVLDIELLTMEEAGLVMGGCVSGLLPARDVGFQAAYNQNIVNLWVAGVRPPMRMDEGKLVLDFAYLDEWMRRARARGCHAVVWFLGGDPYGFPNTMSLFRDLARLDNRDGRAPMTQAEFVRAQGAEENRDRPLPRARELFKEWVRQVDEHARQAGWPEVILTPFDEPAKWVQEAGRGADPEKGIVGTGPWIKSYFKDACAAIREAAPRIRIYGSIHHVDRSGQNEGLVFLDDVDVFCTNAIHEDPKVGDKVRAAKKSFWQYSGVQTDPLSARFAFGFFFGAYDSRGSLCWAYNWGNGWDNSEGDNWMYAWQTPFDTIPAPYFEGLREAWDDRRTIETFRKRFAQEPEAMVLLSRTLEEAAVSRREGGRDTVDDFWAAADDASKMDLWRGRLLDRLARGR